MSDRQITLSRIIVRILLDQRLADCQVFSIGRIRLCELFQRLKYPADTVVRYRQFAPLLLVFRILLDQTLVQVKIVLKHGLRLFVLVLGLQYVP